MAKAAGCQPVHFSRVLAGRAQLSLEQARQARLDMRKRFKDARALTREHQDVYYSSYRVGMTRLHLGKDAGLIRQHHTNWRLEALKSLDRGRGARSDSDLHYSAVVTLSEADARALREHWVRAIAIDFFSLG